VSRRPVFLSPDFLAGFLGPDSSGLPKSFNNLGMIYKKQGLYAEAELLLRRALAIEEKALGPDQPDVAGSRELIGHGEDPLGWPTRPTRVKLSYAFTSAPQLHDRDLLPVVQVKSLDGHHHVVGIEPHRQVELELRGNLEA
jgi:Tetratricopeptide repeat